ncbi:MAG: hypothetical protein GX903_11910 [Spirochaetales bacterium]|nr:hypothetical protein [Spirochaetales bacterium]
MSYIEWKEKIKSFLKERLEVTEEEALRCVSCFRGLYYDKNKFANPEEVYVLACKRICFDGISSESVRKLKLSGMRGGYNLD